MALSGGKIVKKVSVNEFSKRPAATFRLLQYAVTTKKTTSITE